MPRSAYQAMHVRHPTQTPTRERMPSSALKKCRPTWYTSRPRPGPWHTPLLQLALGCLPAARSSFNGRQSRFAGTPCRLLWGASRIQLQVQLRPFPLRGRRLQLGLSLSCRQAEATMTGLHRQLKRGSMCHEVAS